MRHLTLIGLLLLLTVVGGDAKPVDLTGENFSLEIPDTWQMKQAEPVAGGAAPATILTAAAPDSKGVFQLMAGSNPHGVTANNPNFVANVKQNVTRNAASKGNTAEFTKDEEIKIGDVPAYLMHYHVTSAGQQVQCRFYLLTANDKVYLMLTFAQDDAQDQVLEGIVNSVHFASPPKLPVAPVSHHRLKLALAVGAALALVLGVIVVVVLLMRRNQSAEE